MRHFLLVAALLQPLSPAYASVHIRELKNGDFRVSKYNDDNPKITVARIYTEKSRKVPETRSVVDKSNQIFTAEGKQVMDVYWEKLNKWWQEPIEADKRSLLVQTKGQYYCGVSGHCPGPEGQGGRPIRPRLSEGVHFIYGTKQETVYVSRPNPKYGKVREVYTHFSDRARNPGGLPFIGSTERMTPSEYREYWHYITR